MVVLMFLNFWLIKVYYLMLNVHIGLQCRKTCGTASAWMSHVLKWLQFFTSRWSCFSDSSNVEGGYLASMKGNSGKKGILPDTKLSKFGFGHGQFAERQTLLCKPCS